MHAAYHMTLMNTPDCTYVVITVPISASVEEVSVRATLTAKERQI